MRRSWNTQLCWRSRAARIAAVGRTAACMPGGPPRREPRMAPAPSVARLVDRLEEFSPELRVVFVVAAPERGPGARVPFAHAAHLRAQVHRVEVHGNSVRLQHADQLVRD